MPQLAGLIRSKYPGEYDDLDDAELEQKVLAKYPEYQDLKTDREAPAALKVENPEVDKAVSGAKDFLKSNPVAKTPEESDAATEKPGLVKSFADSVSKFVEGHPIVKRFLMGPEPHKFTKAEAEEANKETDIFGNQYPQIQEGQERQIQGPGIMSIPGANKVTDWLSQKITGSEGNFRLGAGAVTKAIGDILSTGFDPRSVGVQRAIHDPNIIDAQFRAEDVPPPTAGELPPIRRGTEIPYKVNENITTENMPIRPGPDFTPPEEFIPAPETNIQAQGPTEDDLFKQALEKFNMGRPVPPEMGTPQSPEGYQNLVAARPDLYGSEQTPEQPTEQISGQPDIYDLGEINGPQEELATTGAGKPSTFKNPFEPSFSRVEEPQAARTESGKLAIGADIKSLGKVLGTSLYQGDIAPIATKELLQNSIDAVRHLGTEGKIDVLFDRNENTIKVTDNGKGLTKKELETVFTDLGASGKREDVNAAGGFGLAKAAPLLGGKKVEVVSVAKDPKTGKLISSSFEGTPDELLSGVDIKQKEVASSTPTGTLVKVHVPENSDFYLAKQFVEKLGKHSHGIAAQIRTGMNYVTGNKNISSLLDPIIKGEGKSVATVNSPSARSEIILPEDPNYGTRSYLDMHLLNNGMYQTTKPMYLGAEAPNIPISVIVDVRPKVPEGHGDYPFTANREELRGSAQKQIEQYIQDNIIKPSIGKRIDELKRLYKEMPSINIGRGEFPNTFGKKFYLYDPKGQLSEYDMEQITKNPSFLTMAKTISDTMDEAVKVMGSEKDWIDRLERIGIIFDDKVHGIHIPNPGAEKSAILINPFIAIDRMSPDEASANILHTILHELAHVDPSIRGHNEGFTVRLGEIYAKFGARRSVEAQDNILKSVADPNIGLYDSEIQDVLSIYQESRGRTATQTDLLSGTGIGSESNRGGKGSIPPGSKSNGEGTPPTAETIDKLLNALKEAGTINAENTAAMRVERARRFAAFEGVKTTGQAGAAKSLGKLKGEYEKMDFSDFEDTLSKPEIDSLFTAIKQANITTGEKARGFTALFKLLNGEGVPQRNELMTLNDVFGGNFGGKILELHGGLGGTSIKLSKTANTMKALRSSMDMSAPLRQGIGLIHRPEWHQAFIDMFKYFANPEFYNYSMRAIQNDPVYLVSRDAGLFLAKPDDLLSGEENFMNSYIHHIPRITGVPMAVDASERAYTGFLNDLRFRTFKNLIANAKDAGLETFDVTQDEEGNKHIEPTEVTKNIAKYINVSTGRGSLGRFDKISQELNTIIWSPKLLSSRLTMLNPKYYMNLDKFTRMEAIKSLFAITAFGIATGTLGALLGGKSLGNPLSGWRDTNKLGDMNWFSGRNPQVLSTDFGKTRFGTNVADPWGGFQQPIVATARLITGEANGKPQTRTDTLENFSVNKLSPMAALAYEIGSAKKFTGKPGEFENKYGEKKYLPAEIANSFVPMFLQDVKDVYQTHPGFAAQVGLDAASFFGMGIQNYPEARTLQQPKLKFRKLALR